jgi:membrane protein DedA with SNARE-associated domain
MMTQAAAWLRAASAKAAGSGIAGGIGAAAGIALLLPMEAGVPIPVPADLVMLAVGARVGAGAIPLPVAILAFEAVAIVGTTALFVAARGPGHAVVTRLGPRLGLTTARLARATNLIERRGRPALAVGRATPGLRTLTVIAAGGSGLSPGRALPALIAGSSVFLQAHLLLGYFLGSAAVHALHTATGPALAVLALIVAGGIVFWFARRSRRRAAGSLAEAACPACVTLAYLAEQPRDLKMLAQDQPHNRAREANPTHATATALNHSRLTEPPWPASSPPARPSAASEQPPPMR